MPADECPHEQTFSELLPPPVQPSHILLPSWQLSALKSPVRYLCPLSLGEGNSIRAGPSVTCHIPSSHQDGYCSQACGHYKGWVDGRQGRRRLRQELSPHSCCTIALRTLLLQIWGWGGVGQQRRWLLTPGRGWHGFTAFVQIMTAQKWPKEPLNECHKLGL
jgi:hypothetical protein